MRKPRRKNNRVWDYSKCQDFIEAKYKINTTDYADHFGEMTRWCKWAGETYLPCPHGVQPEIMKAHQAQFARYRADVVAGKFQDNPYQNFWHWLLDEVGVQRGGTIRLNKELGQGAEPWQKAILGLFLKEFGAGKYETNW